MGAHSEFITILLSKAKLDHLHMDRSQILCRLYKSPLDGTINWGFLHVSSTGAGIAQWLEHQTCDWKVAG